MTKHKECFSELETKWVGWVTGQNGFGPKRVFLAYVELTLNTFCPNSLICAGIK